MEGERAVATLLICAEATDARLDLERCAMAVRGVERVLCVADLGRARDMVRSQAPDVVFLDAHLAGPGPDTVRRLVAGHPSSRVYLFGSRDDFAAVARALATGASGFLRPHLSSVELAAVLAHALASQEAEPSAAPETALPPVQSAVPRPELTEREIQVLIGMSEGKSNGEIGRSLYLSEDTVKTHAQRLFRKLRVNDRAHAVATGFRLGLVS
jgi:DNA-binding NarL/FixJ family response regulator